MPISQLKKIFFALGLLAVLAACGQNGDETASNIATPTTKAPVAEEESVVSVVTVAPADEVEASEEPTEPTSAGATFAYDVTFSEHACDFVLPENAGEITCGTIEVPANRQELENGRVIDLPIAIFHSTSSDPGIPMIYLDGGPGGSSLETIQYSYDDSIAPFLADRDYIAFDQRGTGLSEPSLYCDETRELELEMLDDTRDEEVQNREYLVALRACYDRLVADGADLSAYNSREGAADLVDILRALNHETIHINGVSYGTRLGLTVMRDYPEIVESAVLDSPVPLELNTRESLPDSMAGAFAEFFAGCTADPECAAAYPTLEDDFYALVDHLNENPLTFPVPDVFTGEEYEVWFDGESLMGTLFQTLYSNEMFPTMAKVIDQLQNGDTSEIRWIEANFLASGIFISEGVYHSVRCNEEVPFFDIDVLNSSADNYPELADFFSDSGILIDICENVWQVEKSPSFENEPVVSDIPTLLLAGEYDPVTPFAYGRVVAESLSNVFYYEVPHVGHGVHLSDECPMSMTLAFLRDSGSEPDSGCLAGMTPPNYPVLGEVDTAVTLVPFSGDLQGVTISSVRPAEWDEFQSTLFVRGSSAADQTALVFQAYDSRSVAPDDVVALFTDQLGLTDIPATPELYTDSNGRGWEITRALSSDLPTDFAVYGGSDYTYVVIFAMQSGEGDLWRESVLLPALNEMQVE